jgi:hypothetical protein
MKNKASLISSAMMHDSKIGVMSGGILLEKKREASSEVIVKCVESII